MRLVIIICLTCILVSCHSPKKELLPGKLSADSVIPHDEMIHVLMDVHLIEASLDLQRNLGKNTTQLTLSYYQWLCNKYHMSNRKFRDNMNYYKMDPVEFSKMYHDVLTNLTDMVKKQGEPVVKKSLRR